jgi:drug/metabolite transporter (DMT)-like permease
MQTITTRSQRFSPIRILAIGLILYGCAFVILSRNRSFEPAEAIIVLVLFGGVFSCSLGQGLFALCRSRFPSGRVRLR